MKRGVIATLIGLIGILGTSTCFAQKGGTAAPAMKTSIDSASYAIGINIGRSVAKDSVEINVDLLKAGIIDAMKGADSQRLTDSAAQMILTRLQEGVVDRAKNRVASDNKKKGEAFLNANKSQPGVKVTSSGLQYLVLSPGNGTPPSGDDIVSVNYTGTLIDGTEFDKSDPENPVEFGVHEVIAGWVEALQMMKPGAKWRIFVPSSLAYGEAGAGGVIGPNETLIFEIELLSVKKN